MRGIPHAHTERWPPDASPERSGPARRGSGDGAGSGPHEMPVDRRATGPMSVVADGVAADDVSGQLTSDVQRDLVKDVQRIWILSAMAKIACERGPESVTVREIVGRAGVSRRRFYELFENREDCFRAVFDEAITRAAERTEAAYEAEDAWEDRLRAGLLALLTFFDSEPEL